MSKKSIYDRNISYQEYKALRERPERGKAPSVFTDKKRERLAMRSPGIKKFLAEEQAEIKRLEQEELEALQKAAGEQLVAEQNAREEQARKQGETEKQERQDKELQRTAWKKIADQPVQPPTRRPPGKPKSPRVQKLYRKIRKGPPYSSVEDFSNYAVEEKLTYPTTWKKDGFPGWAKVCATKAGLKKFEGRIRDLVNNAGGSIQKLR